MNSVGRVAARHHPNYVEILDAKTEGVRSYREPAEPRPLQLAFLTPEGEAHWVEGMRAMRSAGAFEAADRQLREALEGFDGRMARLCKALRPEDVTLDGWEDLNPILAEFEGPLLKAITIGLTNEPDLVFEAGQDHPPLVVIGLYSDDAFDFSNASEDDLLDECRGEMPAWVGHEEDVEFYADMPALAELNSALIQSKHRYFLRDGRDGVEGRAPGGYVEYVLGCWVRAVRFCQAVSRALDEHGVPGGARVMIGTAALHTDFAALLRSARTVTLDGAAGRPQGMATLTLKKWVPREDPDLALVESGSALRQKIREPEPSPVEEAAPAPEAMPPQVDAVETPASTDPTKVSRIAPVPAKAPAKPSWIQRLFGLGKGRR